MTIDKDAVIGQLTAEDVARHLGITGTWRGRWMRSMRCGTADHSSDAFALARDGMWHCWACDKGGDLLALVAASEGLDVRADFPRVLEIAARIAGVDDSDSFGAQVKLEPKPRAPAPPVAPLADRIALAKRRAAWVWDRLLAHADGARQRSDGGWRTVAELYLESRGLSKDVQKREEIRETPMRATMEEIAKHPELKSLAYLFTAPGLVVPVRAVEGGALVDLRVRRYEPRPGQPKIVGLLGGITCGPAEQGRPRQLVGCYGRPHVLDDEQLVVIVEGLMDYLTALHRFPEAHVLGAVEAGSLALVTAHAARLLDRRDSHTRILIVEQNDPPRTLRDGRVVAGAADASINEDPTAAAKAAIRILGPKRVGWLFCGPPYDGQAAVTLGEGIKDLNDLVCAKVDADPMIRWESEIGT